MGKGLLAQWRRGVARRGLAGAALLAIPVAVAATLGFSVGFSGLNDSLSAISGPSPGAAANGAGPRRALVALVGDTRPAGGETTNGGAGGAPEPVAGGTEPAGPDTSGGTGGSNGGDGGAAPLPDAPTVDLPDGGGGVGSLVDGVNQTVSGLVGGQ